MAELRYNPITRDWVMAASHRQGRPQMPKDWCPFCAGSGKVPEGGYDVLRYGNDFPALSQTPPVPDAVATDFYITRPAYGRCEVLLYSDKHDARLWELSDTHVHKLAQMWRECFNEMKEDTEIKYVYIFENRGELVGVTMPHPHGQAYGYSFIPQKLNSELISVNDHYSKTGECLFCHVLREEESDGRRIIFLNKHFTVFIPFFSPVAYGVHIMSNRHIMNIGEMDTEELNALGEIVRDCAGMYDYLFNKPFPYMMCMHNSPVNTDETVKTWHFHIEYYPPMRDENKQQFFASSETGAGAWCNPTAPEEKASELREAYKRYKADK